MKEILEIIKNFSDFAAVFCFTKCIKAMVCAFILFPFILILRKTLKNANTNIKLGLLLLFIPMVFMGNSKLFYYTGFVKVTVFLNKIIKPEYGKIYFAVVFILLVRYLYLNIVFNHKIRKLENTENREILLDIIEDITLKDRVVLIKKYLKKTKLYITEENISPFSGGILKPYIVLPRDIIENWEDKDFKAILIHELLHIKSGHIIYFIIFDLIKIYWWINPFVYICKKLVQEDAEKACDESTVYYSQIERQEYGNLLLDMTCVLNEVENRSIASFVDRNGFRALKKRLLNLKKKSIERLPEINRKISGVFLICLVCITCSIVMTSYPRYTKIEEISVYDEKINIITYDINKECQIAWIVDDRLVIDEEGFREYILNNDIHDEYVYLSYGTIMKVPGVGGMGYVGMVSTADCTDIIYLIDDNNIKNIILEFCIKYLI